MKNTSIFGISIQEFCDLPYDEKEDLVRCKMCHISVSKFNDILFDFDYYSIASTMLMHDPLSCEELQDIIYDIQDEREHLLSMNLPYKKHNSSKNKED